MLLFQSKRRKQLNLWLLDKERSDADASCATLRMVGIDERLAFHCCACAHQLLTPAVVALAAKLNKNDGTKVFVISSQQLLFIPTTK